MLTPSGSMMLILGMAAIHYSHSTYSICSISTHLNQYELDVGQEVGLVAIVFDRNEFNYTMGAAATPLKVIILYINHLIFVK
jgi:hypothetical protein